VASFQLARSVVSEKRHGKWERSLEERSSITRLDIKECVGQQLEVPAA
jgi:hypothetical protein